MVVEHDIENYDTIKIVKKFFQGIDAFTNLQI